MDHFEPLRSFKLCLGTRASMMSFNKFKTSRILKMMSAWNLEWGREDVKPCLQQCAAVRIQLAAIMLPPQPTRIFTMKGHASRWVGYPPTIRCSKPVFTIGSLQRRFAGKEIRLITDFSLNSNDFHWLIYRVLPIDTEFFTGITDFCPFVKNL